MRSVRVRPWGEVLTFEVVLADTDRARPTTERLLHLTEVAHQQCFIANSLTSDVVVTPTFTWVGDGPA